MTIKYYESPFHATNDEETANKLCEAVDNLLLIRKAKERLEEINSGLAVPINISIKDL